MTPFDETTWTTNESGAAPTYGAATDDRPQGQLGIVSLVLGITSWALLALFVAGVRSPYSAWPICVSTLGAIVFGAIGMAPAVTGSGVRRGAAIAGFVLGLAVVAGVIAVIAIAFILLASGTAQLG